MHGLSTTACPSALAAHTAELIIAHVQLPQAGSGVGLGAQDSTFATFSLLIVDGCVFMPERTLVLLPF